MFQFFNTIKRVRHLGTKQSCSLLQIIFSIWNFKQWLKVTSKSFPLILIMWDSFRWAVGHPIWQPRDNLHRGEFNREKDTIHHWLYSVYQQLVYQTQVILATDSLIASTEQVFFLPPAACIRPILCFLCLFQFLGTKQLTMLNLLIRINHKVKIK